MGRRARLGCTRIGSPGILGVSGREMLAALLAGERDPRALAQPARTRMRTKIDALEEAFVGHFTDQGAGSEACSPPTELAR